jgi:hypothetical protein
LPVSDNTAIGHQALRSNTTGYSNTAVGWLTLDGNTTGRANTATGDLALYHNSTGFNNSATGESALTSNTTGSGNTADGLFSLYSNTTGNNNTAIGNKSLFSNTIGKNNTAIGTNTDVNANNFINSTALGNGALITASNQVRIGNANVKSIGGYVNWSNISDGRFKKNVKDNVKALEFIMKLKPVSYNLDITGLNAFTRKNMKAASVKELQANDDAQDIKTKEKIVYSGFVAQDVEKAAKETGYDFSSIDAPKNDNDVHGLRYADFVVPLAKAVQELSEENEELKKELAD